MSVFQDPVVVAALIGGGGVVIAAVATLVGVLSQSSNTRKTATETRLDAKMDAVIERQDAQIKAAEASAAAAGQAAAEAHTLATEVKATAHRHMRAVGSIFRTIHDQVQWPDGRGPMLNPQDIADLEDTDALPHSWVRRRTV